MSLFLSVFTQRKIAVKVVIDQYQDELLVPANAEEESFRWKKDDSVKKPLPIQSVINDIFSG